MDKEYRLRTLKLRKEFRKVTRYENKVTLTSGTYIAMRKKIAKNRKKKLKF